MRATPDIWTRYRGTIDRLREQLAECADRPNNRMYKPDINQTSSDNDDTLQSLGDIFGFTNKSMDTNSNNAVV